MTSNGFYGILKGASVVGAGMIFSKGISLLAEVIVARELASAEFGTAIFAYTTILTVSGIALIGIPEGFTYFLSILDERGDTETAFRIVISGVTILAAVLTSSASIIYILPFSFIQQFGISSSQWQWIQLLVPLVIVYPVTQLAFGVMRGYDRSVPKVISDDILNKLIALSAVTIAIWQDGGIFIFLSFYFGQYLLSSVFASGYTLYLLKQKFTEIENKRYNLLREDSRRLLSYSWPLALKNATRRLLGNTDIVLVGILLASSAVGYYRVGYVISQLGMVVLVSITYLFTPRTARRYDSNDTQAMEHLYRQATKWSTLLSLPLVLIMVYYPAELIKLLFGAEYSPGSIVLTVLAVDVLLRSGMGTAASVLRAIDRTRVDFVVTAVTMVANIALSYVLILEFGIIGAAIGTFLSILFMNMTQILLVYHFISIHPFSKLYIETILILVTISTVLPILLDSIIGDVIVTQYNIPVTMFAFGILFVFIEISYIWLGGLLTQTEKETIYKYFSESPLNLI
ncbi:hypothetical protein BRD16_00735 [Halobacteriales archaeon SW_6_65_46]|nr:MAG: hypothetical protein BRD16_00735 [Halobacteriales archaeon SW_6_65_46]